jgi:hypothetical protein
MMRSLLGLGMVLGFIVLPVLADPPGAPSPADPGREFVVTPEAGAWMICAAPFTGSDAPELGRQLVQYIRGHYHLPAYTFNRGEQERNALNAELERQRQQQQAGNPLIPIRRRVIRIEDQVAVLIGGYPDEYTARRALDTVRRLPPPELRLNSGRPALDTVFFAGDDGKIQQRETINPFSTAFVTPNPVAGQRPAPPDPLWEKLNQYEGYSLLECKKPLTLLVKQYAGAGGLVQGNSTKGFLDKLWSSGIKPGDALDAAGQQAHELARVLRELNFQAYVLHTRTNSLVTVGAFDSLEDPEYKRVTQQLAALQQRFNAANHDPFKLNPVPAPMSVPKKTNQ